MRHRILGLAVAAVLGALASSASATQWRLVLETGFGVIGFEPRLEISCNACGPDGGPGWEDPFGFPGVNTNEFLPGPVTFTPEGHQIFTLNGGIQQGFPISDDNAFGPHERVYVVSGGDIIARLFIDEIDPGFSWQFDFAMGLSDPGIPGPGDTQVPFTGPGDMVLLGGPGFGTNPNRDLAEVVLRFVPEAPSWTLAALALAALTRRRPRMVEST